MITSALIYSIIVLLFLIDSIIVLLFLIAFTGNNDIDR